MLAKVSTHKKNIKDQSDKCRSAQKNVEVEIDRVAKREKKNVEASMQAVMEAEKKLTDDLKKLDETLEHAYKNDKKFKKVSDTFDDEQNRRMKLVEDLTNSYRGAQKTILESNVSTEDKKKQLGDISKTMQECMGCDYEYAQMMSVLTSSLEANGVKLLKN